MNQASETDPLSLPSRFSVIIGVVNPADPSLPVEHFDTVRQSVMAIIQVLLSRLQLQTRIPQLSLRRDDQHHFLDVLLLDPEPSMQPPLFEELEPRQRVPFDVAAALAAEVRALLYKLMTKQVVPVGLLSRSVGTVGNELAASIEVAQGIRKAPGSQVSLTANGVTHVLDLGVLEGIESLHEEVKVRARVRAIGPRHAYLERIELMSELDEVKMPTTGWLTLPSGTAPKLRTQLEQACQAGERSTLALKLWVHRVYRTVRAMQPSSRIQSSDAQSTSS